MTMPTVVFGAQRLCFTCALLSLQRNPVQAS